MAAQGSASVAVACCNPDRILRLCPKIIWCAVKLDARFSAAAGRLAIWASAKLTRRCERSCLPQIPRRALERSERAELVGAQADRRGCEILLEMRYRGGPRNWKHGGGTLQQPGQCDLARHGPVALGDPGQRRIWSGEPASCQRVPGNKGHAGAGAHIDQPV